MKEQMETQGKQIREQIVTYTEQMEIKKGEYE